ncbi:MAG: hypothetical protein WA996_22655 [Candidatus Promineifilaceae bacterium]
MSIATHSILLRLFAVLQLPLTPEKELVEGTYSSRREGFQDVLACVIEEKRAHYYPEVTANNLSNVTKDYQA